MDMMIDYTNCITNLACSVLQEFGVEPRHNTLAMADEVMKEGHDYEKVMGKLL